MGLTIYKNAKVYSVDLDNTETRAEAIAIKDGLITFIGSNAEVDKLVDKDTKVVDCKGGSLLPGFGDAHMHISLSHKKFAVADLANLITNLQTQTPEDAVRLIQERLVEFANKHKDLPVIKGNGWDRGWFLGNIHGLTYKFTKKDIDAVINDKPVVIDGYDGHICLLNSKALEAANINSFDDPGGLIERDENGEPTGIIKEPVMMTPVCNAIKGYEFSRKDVEQGLETAQDVFAAKGYTYLSDCMQFEEGYDVIKEFALNNKLKMRIDGVFNCNNKTMDNDLAKAIKNKDKYNVKDLMKVDTVKYFIDGELAMKRPLEDKVCEQMGLEKGFKYPLLWDKNDLIKSMEQVQKEGFNIHVHSMGDYATEVSIDAMENAQNFNNKGLRNIIAHCSFVDEPDKMRMGKLGIIASIQPEWQAESTQSNPAMTQMVGEEIHKTIYPSKSLEDNGVVCAYGSDFPVYMPNALSNIQTAMTRVANPCIPNYEDYKNYPAQSPYECVTLKQALKNQTINVAYQFHREDITGSLKVGKSADFVVLDKDIEKVDVKDIVKLQVMETVFKGNITYKR